MSHHLGEGLRRASNSFRCHRLRWIVGLSVLVIALAIGGVACYVVSEVTYPGEQVAKVMLPDTDGYVSFNLKPGFSQSLNFKSFLDCFFNTASVDDRWQGLLQQIEDDWGIDIEEDVQPWLGPEIAHGTFHGPTFPDSGPEHCFYVGTSDEAATQAVLNKWLQKRVEKDCVALGNETYRGVLMTLVNPQAPTECYAVTHGYGLAFLGNRTRLERTIDLMLDGKPSLWDNADFQTARAKLPQERMGMGYFDAEHFLDVFVEPNMGDPVAQAIYDAFSPYAPAYAGAAISFGDEGVKLDLYAPTPEALNFAVQEPLPLRAAGFVPGNSLAFAGGQNLEIWWQQFLSKLDELAQNPDLDAWLEENLNIGAFEEDWGIHFEEDVFSWMTGEIAAAALPYWGEGPLGEPASLLLLEMGNQTLAEAKMAGIVNAMLDELHESGQAADTYATEIGGVPATMMRWEDSPGGGLKTKQGHLFLDDFVVIGSSERALGAAVNAYQNPTTSLAQSGEFQWMLSNLPTDKTGLLYVEGSQTADLVLANVVPGMAGKEVYYQKLAALVEPVQSAGFSYSVGADDSTATFAFHVTGVEVPQTAVYVNSQALVGEGHDFLAPIDICRVQNLHAANYVLQYDSNVIELVNITSGNLGGTEIPVGWGGNGSGTVNVVQNVPGPDGATGHGHLAIVRFHVVGSSGNRSDIALSGGVLTGESGEIPSDWFGDSVEVFVGGSISGVVRDESGTPIPNAEVYAWDHYSGQVMPTATGTERLDADAGPGALNEGMPPWPVTSRSGDMGPAPVLTQSLGPTQASPQPWGPDARPQRWLEAGDVPIARDGMMPAAIGPEAQAHAWLPPQAWGPSMPPEAWLGSGHAQMPHGGMMAPGVGAESQTQAWPQEEPTGPSMPPEAWLGSGHTQMPHGGMMAPGVGAESQTQAWRQDEPTGPNAPPEAWLDSGHAPMSQGGMMAPAVGGESQTQAWRQDEPTGANAPPEAWLGSGHTQMPQGGMMAPVVGPEPEMQGSLPATAMARGFPGVSVGQGFEMPSEGGLLGQPSSGKPASGYTQTGPDGSYTIDLPSGDYRVYVRATGYIPEYYDDEYGPYDAVPVSVTAPNDCPNIDFALGPAGSISGVVRDEAGSPLEGAWVYAWTCGDSGCWGRSALTSADGSYAISELLAGDYSVYASASGYLGEYYDNVYWWDEATLVPVTPPNDTPNTDFALGPGGSISGVVRDEAGNPICGAWVETRACRDGDCWWWWGWGRTSGSGSYTVANLPPGDWRVQAYASGYLSEYYDNVYWEDEATLVAVTPPNDTPNIDFELGPGGSISGVVRDEAGNPIAGASVGAHTCRDGGCWGWGVGTSADGTYSVTNLPPGDYRVQACAACYLCEYYDGVYEWEEATLVVVAAPNDTSGIDFELGLGGSISGVVRDEAGNPIGGAWVNAWHYDTGNWGGESQTAEDGSYTICGLPTGSYRVRAGASGYLAEYYDNVYWSDEATPVAVTLPNDTPNIDFALGPGGSISGVVRDEAGSPIEGAWVSAGRDGKGWSSGDYTSSDGSYTIRELIGGSYRVWADASGYLGEYYDDVYWWDEATLVGVTVLEDTGGIDFALGAGGSISGVVRDEAGNPIAGASVGAHTCRDGGCWGWGVGTSADGTYSVTNLPPGDYRVQACAACYLCEYYDGVYEWEEATLVVVAAPNDTSGIDFELGLGGSISGVVRDEAGSPIEGAWVDAWTCGEHGCWGWGAGTSADGTYSVTNLPPGDYRVQACAACYLCEYYDGVYGWDEATLVAVVAPNDTPGIDFELGPGGSISGVVTDEGGNPIAGAWVNAWHYDTGNPGGESQTAEDGSYTICGLPTGSYRVRAYGSGYLDEYYDNVYWWEEATPVSVTVPNDTSSIDFALGPGGSISGVVTDEEGNPISGAWVNAWEYDHGWGWGTQTLADGSYSISNLYPGDHRVQACAACYLCEYYDGVYEWEEATLVVVAAPNDTPNIDFALGLGGSISGVVRDELGNPIEGAWVSADRADGKGWSGGDYTSSDGSYTIPELIGGSYRVRADASGYVAEYYDDVYWWDEATLVGVTVLEDTGGIDFALGAGGSISGVVRDELGNPIEGAWVSADRADGKGWSGGDYTSSDGSYTIPELIGGSYRVRADASGYVAEYYDDVYWWDEATLVGVTVLEDTGGIDFALGPGGSISGVVRDEAGNPIEGAWVNAGRDGKGWSGGDYTSSDGSYTIPELIGGSYRVRAGASGYLGEYYDNVYWWDEATLVAVTVPNDTGGIDFALGAGGSISGVVRDEAGNPIGGAWVNADRADGKGWSGGDYTSSDGSYTIPELIGGSYRVRAGASGYLDEYYDNVYWSDEATPVAVTLPNDTPNIDFALGPGGSISGTVRDRNGNPTSGAWVYAERYDEWWSGSGQTSADGTYAITTLLSGNYRVYVRASGYASEVYDNVYWLDEATPVGVNVLSDTPNIDFVLGPGGSISGVVRDEAGNPIAGAWVNAWSYDRGSLTFGSQTSADGRYVIPDLPPGDYRVQAGKPGYAAEYYDNAYWYDTATPVVVSASGDALGVDFELGPGGSISGTVADEAGNPIVGAWISVWRYDIGYWFDGSNTLQDGSYSIQDMPPGEYRVRAEKPGYAPRYYDGVCNWSAASPVPVIPLTNTPAIDFTLSPGGSISGTVADEAGNPIAGARVSVWRYDSGDWVGGYVSVQDGSYYVPDLCSGSYRLRAEASGYAAEFYDGVYDQSAATPVAVAASYNTSNIDFALGPGGSISGTVRDEAGNPIAGTWVNVWRYDSGDWFDSSYTLQDGSYTIRDLAPGNYYVHTQPSGYVGELYDNAYWWEEATPVAVTVSNDTPGIDFTLAREAVLVQVNSATIAAGSSASVDIRVKNFPEDGFGLGCYDIRIDYDPAMVAVTGVSPGDAPFHQPIYSIHDNYVSIAQYSTAMPGPAGDIRIADLEFTCLGTGKTSLVVTIMTLCNANGDELGATPVDGTILQVSLLAETSLAEERGGDGVVTIPVSIDRFKDPVTGETASDVAITCYKAQALYDPEGIEMLTVRPGDSPFDNPQFAVSNSGGYTGFNQCTEGAEPPVAVARLVPRLIGCALHSYELDVTFYSIRDSSESEVPQEDSQAFRFQRGDIQGDGDVDIVDAMFGAQYLVGIRPIEHIRPLNMASVRHDGEGGDKMSIVDCMFIAQYRVGIRDCYFNVVQ